MGAAKGVRLCARTRVHARTHTRLQDRGPGCLAAGVPGLGALELLTVGTGDSAEPWAERAGQLGGEQTSRAKPGRTAVGSVGVWPGPRRSSAEAAGSLRPRAQEAVRPIQGGCGNRSFLGESRSPARASLQGRLRSPRWEPAVARGSRWAGYSQKAILRFSPNPGFLWGCGASGFLDATLAGCRGIEGVQPALLGIRTRT